MVCACVRLCVCRRHLAPSSLEGGPERAHGEVRWPVLLGPRVGSVGVLPSLGSSPFSESSQAGSEGSGLQDSRAAEPPLRGK